MTVPHQHDAPRTPLTRERVLLAAVALADRDGLEALTMRSLAVELAAKPMSLYHHVPNKAAILDGIVDLVFREIELPSDAASWRDSVAERCRSVRRVLSRHPWAIGLLESRSNPGAATLEHHDALLGVLRRGGFSVPLAAHAYALLDSYVYGFALQESSLPRSGDINVDAPTGVLLDFAGPDLPHLREMAVEHILKPGYSFADEFDIGLGFVLDALEARVGATVASGPATAAE